ncbi:MAG TPA: DUF6541 family protein [Bellilinea sp.]|nr:DUF6541 family protein [Bellilinea sp.]
MTHSPLQTAAFSLAALLILLQPGFAWLVWSRQSRGFFTTLADAVGISISLTALVALAGFYLDVGFTRPVLIGLYGLCGLALLIGLVWRISRINTSRAVHWQRLLIILLGIVGIVGLVVWRLYQARSLVLPAWVDSVHHTLIVRIIMENGGLPATLQPYLPADFSYHFGFHVLAALFAGITHIEPAAALLWFGQMLNALIALSVYRLAMELWSDWRRAVLAAVLVGFALHMPAYYLTWGRYTLITGLLLLPLAMAALLRLTRQPRNLFSILTAILLTAGTALSHYTALLLLGFFTLILVFVRLMQSLKDEGDQSLPRWPAAWRPALSAAVGVLLASPWLWRVWQQMGNQAVVGLVSPLDSSQAGYFDYILYLLGPTHNAVWLAFAAVGLVWALLRRPVNPLALWGLLLVLLTLPWGLRLGPWRPDHMAIVLFLPAAFMAADLVFSLVDWVGHLRWRWPKRLAQAAILLAVGTGIIWSTWQTRNILNPETVFIDQADRDALDWVRENTPPDARFMLNTTAWMGRTYRGVDGGYWLLPYAGRQTILPPVMYTYAGSEYVAQIEKQAEQISKLTTCDEVFWTLVNDFKATYVYLHSGRGSLQPDALANCTQLVNVYRRGDVAIYEIAK